MLDLDESDEGDVFVLFFSHSLMDKNDTGEKNVASIPYFPNNHLPLIDSSSTTFRTNRDELESAVFHKHNRILVEILPIPVPPFPAFPWFRDR